MKESLNFAVKGRATDNNLLERAAESLDKLAADVGIYRPVDQRQRKRPTYSPAGNHRHNLLAVDFFENQRHTYNQVGPHLRHGRQQEAGRRGLPEKGHECPDGKRHKHIERTPVGMGQGEERQGA